MSSITPKRAGLNANRTMSSIVGTTGRISAMCGGASAGRSSAPTSASDGRAGGERARAARHPAQHLPAHRAGHCRRHSPPAANRCVTYVGAPYLVDFGDDYEPRMLLLSGQHMTSLPMRGPQKRLLELSYPPPDGGWSTPAARRGDLVKIRLSIATEHMAKGGEIRHAVQRWADGRGYLLHLVQPVVNDEPGAKITLIMSPARR
jgi:hypothetical protein